MSPSQATKASTSQHTWSQLKLLIPGGAITYYLDIIQEFWRIVHSNAEDWGRPIALSGLGLGLTTIALFLYVLMTPWIMGVEPDFRIWRESGVLSKVIPILTGSIVLGWLLLVATMGQYSSLGYLKGTVGVCGVYALTFGILGLLPAPKVRRL